MNLVNASIFVALVVLCRHFRGHHQFQLVASTVSNLPTICETISFKINKLRSLILHHLNLDWIYNSTIKT